MALTNADRAHLNRAVIVSEQSTMRQRHGAVVARGRKVLSVGVNRHRAAPDVVSDPKTESSWHAEIAALRGVEIDGRTTVYVARTTSRGAVNSYPCENCRKELASRGVRRVVFTTAEGVGELHLTN